MIDIPQMRAGPPIKVSATSYMTFLRCPAQAQARYDQRAFPKETVDSFRGALVHRLIARRLRSGPFEDVEHAARAEIGEALNEKMVAIGVNRPSLLAPIIAEAADLFRRFCRFPIVGFQEAEVTIGHDLPDDVTLVGKIDGVFVDGQATPSRPKVLRDWKTGPLGEPFNQLLFYAFVWLLARGEQTRVEAFSLQTGEQARKEPSLADLQKVGERLADLVNQIRSVWDGESTPNKVAGPWCANCPVLASCTEGQEASLMLVSGYRARQ